MPKPEWVERLQALKAEFDACAGKTFHSSWEDFLFCRLCAVEQQQQILVENVVELGKLIGIIDGAQPLTGQQVLLVLSDVKQWTEAALCK